MAQDADPKHGLAPFVTLEGGEGVGKSTQQTLLVERIRKQGLKVEATWEPGATPLGAKIRRLVSQPTVQSPGPEAELLLYLADRAQHYPSELSGGQQQRVAIARALANDPPILIGDEITGELDSETGFEVMEIVARLNHEQGTTVVYVTHDPRMAKFAEHLIQLRDGRIVDV